MPLCNDPCRASTARSLEKTLFSLVPLLLLSLTMIPGRTRRHVCGRAVGRDPGKPQTRGWCEAQVSTSGIKRTRRKRACEPGEVSRTLGPGPAVEALLLALMCPSCLGEQSCNPAGLRQLIPRDSLSRSITLSNNVLPSPSHLNNHRVLSRSR